MRTENNLSISASYTRLTLRNNQSSYHYVRSAFQFLPTFISFKYADR